jgi:asparagine synthase (glutamine-hydrolysing)
MHSPCKRYVIVFNGEIYNYRKLRAELQQQGVVFNTTSDTEVLLALFAAEGEKMLPKLHGMFAFVIWDRLTRRGFAARDPYGIKPLYCGVTKSGVILASQVKALLATGELSREPDPKGQAGFWMLGSVPEPHTWYRDIKAVPAGNCVWIEDGRMSDPVCWWDIGQIWRAAPNRGIYEEEARDVVSRALRETVARHLEADVPVGIFLSGGVDSGALAGLMVELGPRNIEGVTLAYDEFRGTRQDEAPVAGVIASFYGIRHHIRRVSQEEFQSDLSSILTAMDQPSVDGINTWYASKAAAERGLKVVVAGTGGDELFQGYESFQTLPRMVKYWRPLSRVPGMQMAARFAGDLQADRSGNSRWRHVGDWGRTITGAWWLRRSLYAPEDLPALMGKDLAEAGLRGFGVTEWVEAMSGAVPSDSRLALGQIESTAYLRNQLLRDSDWASMGHGVELRTPLVDTKLLNALQNVLPIFYQYKNKELLAGTPLKTLPESVVQKRKTGFGIPVAQWLLDSESSNSIPHPSRSWALRLAREYQEIQV